MRVLAAALLLALFAPPLLAQTPDPQWPDAYPPGNGVTAPKLVQEVKPRYTAEAMAARVQGMVWVECVVEIDGTVKHTRVTRSLDTQYGLDDEAVAAARQWRFVAGTKDGQPIPVVIVIELGFTLRDPEPAPLALPPGFTTDAAPGIADIEWEDTDVESPTLTIGVSRPKGWRVTAVPSVPFAAMSEDASVGVFVFPFTTSTAPDLIPVPQEALQQLGGAVAGTFKRPLAGVGQARIANRVWFWCDLGSMAASGTDHLWIFSTITDGHQVAVGFTVVTPAGAGPLLARVLERLAFARR